MTLSRKLAACALLTLGLSAAPSLTGAAPIGTLQAINGSTTLTQNGVQLASTSPPVSTGIFTGLDNTSINVSDLVFAAGGQSLTFQATPGLTVSAVVHPGSFSTPSCGDPPAAGQVCTPILSGEPSPLNLYNTVSPAGEMSSVATYSLDLAIQDGATTYAGTGIITMQFAQSYQQVLTTLAGGGHIETSYSAQITAGTAGTVTFGGGTSLSLAGLDFTPEARIGGLADGQFLVAPFSTGTFGPLTGTVGVADDNLVVGPLPDFLSFAASPDVNFQLASLSIGVFPSVDCGAPAAASQRCSVPQLPGLEFVNVLTGAQMSSVLSLNVDGLMTDLSGSTPYAGIYSMSFNGLSYQQVLATIFEGGSLTTTYSATFTTDQVPTVAEPVSIMLVGAGMAAVFCRGRRRRTL